MRVSAILKPAPAESILLDWKFQKLTCVQFMDLLDNSDSATLPRFSVSIFIIMARRDMGNEWFPFPQCAWGRGKKNWHVTSHQIMKNQKHPEWFLTEKRCKYISIIYSLYLSLEKVSSAFVVEWWEEIHLSSCQFRTHFENRHSMPILGCHKHWILQFEEILWGIFAKKKKLVFCDNILWWTLVSERVNEW